MATGFNTQTGNGEYHLQFETDNRDRYLLMQETARRCVDGKPFTNADRIRTMTDEELVNVVPCPLGFSIFRCPIDRKCGDCKREWLKQPAEGE